MNFSSIIKKNFQYNFNKFISFFFVNSLIIGLLYIYTSLLTNSSVAKITKDSSLEKILLAALGGLVLFSIVFVTYTNIAFLKNRGKEFGMYLTLGMTTKDLSKIVLLENLGIMFASLFTGLLGGTVLGRLFYMGLGKILNATEIKYELDMTSILLSAGIFGVIFIFNMLFNFRYIKKVSIIDALKSDKKKSVGKSNPIIVIITLILFIVAMVVLPKSLLNSYDYDTSIITGVSIAITFIAPYILIGGVVSTIQFILKRFEGAYNKNIIVLSSLSHRFKSYKNLLYILTLLITGGTFFVGFSYSNYTTTEQFARSSYPYDISFVDKEEFNNVEKEDIETLLKKEGAKISKYNVVPFIDGAMFKVENGTKEGYLDYWNSKSPIVSVSNYNKHMGQNISLEDDELLYLTPHEENLKVANAKEYVFVSLSDEEAEVVNEISNNSEDWLVPEVELKKIIGDRPVLKFTGDNYEKKQGARFSNNQGNFASYHTGTAYVVSDTVYENFKTGSGLEEHHNHLINGENLDEGFDSLMETLAAASSIDESVWDSYVYKESDWEDEKLMQQKGYRPVLFDEILSDRLNQSGSMYFIMIFIGILCMLANGIVLYYKILSDVNDEKERIESLKRIGTTYTELRSIVSKEMACIFLLPIMFGGFMGYYYLTVMFSNIKDNGAVLYSSAVVLFVATVIQFIMYLISRKKYIKEAL